MRDLRRVLGGSTVVAFATVLALAGCGGSGASTDAPVGDAAATEEAAETKDAATLKAEERQAKAEEAKHWRRSEESVESTSVYTYTDENGNTVEETGTNTRTTSYEFDETGNTIKKTEKDSHDWGDSTTTTETTTTYSREENGWPTKAETVTTTSYTYPDGNGGTAERSDDPETTEVTYDYEYDDSGRVTKITTTNEDASSFEFTYGESDMPIAINETTSYRTYSNEGEEKRVTSTSTDEYNDLGILTHETVSTVGEEHSKQHDAEYLYDDLGNMLSAVHNYTYDDDSQGTETRTYTNEKNEDGFVTKVTTTVEGDGKYINERWADDVTIEEGIMPDGSIQATTCTYGDNGERVAGDTQTYDGPYCVRELTYDEQGNQLSSTTTYYDGSVDKSEFAYDENGNNTKATYTSFDGSTRTYTYTYDENGNETAMQISGSDYEAKYTYAYTHFEEISDYLQKSENVQYWLE
jgi:YD repeat-containing protein